MNFLISITAIGEANENEIVYRNGANNGDLLVVTGDLGSAYMGLQVLEREKQVFQVNPNNQPDLDGYSYLIERQLKPEARHDIRVLLEKLEVKDRLRVYAAIELLSENPRPPLSVRIKGSEFLRVRVGDYRILYSINTGRLIILIIDIGHRREIYRDVN